MLVSMTIHANKGGNWILKQEFPKAVSNNASYARGLHTAHHSWAMLLQHEQGDCAASSGWLGEKCWNDIRLEAMGRKSLKMTCRDQLTP
jgi:hypothetical protein